MIEPTDEMVNALRRVHREQYQFGVASLDGAFRAGLTAVLAIVERQCQEAYGDAWQAGWWRGQHELCPRCGVELAREVAAERPIDAVLAEEPLYDAVARPVLQLYDGDPT